MERAILYLVLFLLLIAFTLTLVAAAYFYARYHHLRGEGERLARDRAQTLFQQWRDQHEAEIRRIAREEAQAEFQKKEADLYAEFQKREEQIRNEAVERSRAVQRGQVMEHVFPFLMDLNPEDVRYLGSPVDWIVFRGLRNEEDEKVEILLVEAKTGRASLNDRQQRLRQAVQEGRVQVKWWTARLERVERGIEEVRPKKGRQGITFRVYVEEAGEERSLWLNAEGKSGLSGGKGDASL